MNLDAISSCFSNFSQSVWYGMRSWLSKESNSSLDSNLEEAGNAKCHKMVIVWQPLGGKKLCLTRRVPSSIPWWIDKKFLYETLEGHCWSALTILTEMEQWSDSLTQVSDSVQGSFVRAKAQLGLEWCILWQRHESWYAYLSRSKHNSTQRNLLLILGMPPYDNLILIR